MENFLHRPIFIKVMLQNEHQIQKYDKKINYC